MMKKFILVCLIATYAMCLGACGSTKEEEKLRDLEITVIPQEEEPEVLHNIIEEKQEKPFQICYTLEEDMYLAVGYGKQEAQGYSIQVRECYETPKSIYLDTVLLGPEKTQMNNNIPSYPYIVIKMEKIEDKMINYQ